MSDKTIRVSDDARNYIQKLQTKHTRTTKYIVDDLIKKCDTSVEVDADVLARLEKIRENFNLVDMNIVIKFALDKIKDDIKE